VLHPEALINDGPVMQKSFEVSLAKTSNVNDRFPLDAGLQRPSHYNSAPAKAASALTPWE
jgi:hypothetical protein